MRAISDIEFVEEQRMGGRRHDDIIARFTMSVRDIKTATRRDLINDDVAFGHFSQQQVALQTNPFSVSRQSAQAQSGSKCAGIHRAGRQ